VSENTDGLATRLEAFSRLTEKNEVVWYANLVIMLIILVLEIAPILTKVFADYGPYDRLVEFAQEKVYLTKDLELEGVKDDLNRRRDYITKQKRVVADLQERLSHDVMVEAENPSQGSEAHVNWRNAKNALIRQATSSLTHRSDNGDDG
jgi:hypothetical protein